MTDARLLLDRAALRLAGAGVPSAVVDAELLLAHVTGRPRGMLRIVEQGVPADQEAHFAELVTLRASRVPLQHIVGRAPFRHLELRVGAGVFIPRPETELMVDHVLRFDSAHRDVPGPADLGARREPVDSVADLVVVDLCTGSGALALSLATERAGSRVFAVEVSEEAATWAAANIQDHAGGLKAAGSTVRLIRGDATRVADPGGALAGMRGRVDVVVTNPPYVPQDAVPREPEVRDHDPALALYGGPDGLAVIRRLAAQAAILLRPGGLVIIEHADCQGSQAGLLGVPGVLHAQREPMLPADPRSARRTGHHTAPRAPAGRGSPWLGIVDHLDLAGRPRHTAAVRAPHP